MFPQPSFRPQFGYPGYPHPSLIRSSFRPTYYQPNPGMGFCPNRGMPQRPQRPMFNARPLALNRYPRHNNYKSNCKQEAKFYCETCDRDFRSESQLNAHNEQHAVCGIDGCTFKAHFKVVDKHKLTVHISGLYDKMKALQSSEGVKKWRNERRAKWPTAERTEEKEKIEEEKQKRGERIPVGTDRFGNRLKGQRNLQNDRKFKNKLVTKSRNTLETKSRGKLITKSRGKLLTKSSGKLVTKSRKLGNKTQFKSKAIKAVELNSSSEDERSTWNGNLPPFRGTRELFGNNESEKETEKDLEIEDGEWEELPENTNDADKKSIPVEYNSSLKSLMSAYNSDDYTDDDEPPVAAKISRSDGLPVCDEVNGGTTKEDVPENNKNEDGKTLEKNKKSGSIIKMNGRKRNRRHPHKEDSRNTEKNDEKSTESNVEKEKSRVTLVPRRHFDRHQLLLRKLIRNDVRHEQNVILQCVRYIVNNNFFVPKNENKQNLISQCIRYVVKNNFFSVEDKNVNSSVNKN